ncbi:MAG: ribosome small subunit-dependent GTPase A [Catalinimonas sp.]
MRGIVFKSTGSWYQIRGEDGTSYAGRLRGKFKLRGLKVTNPVAVGDRVEFAPEADGSVVITDLLARRNYIIRKSTHKTQHGHIIAANLDQAVLVATLTLPRTSLGFIDRFLVSAEAFRIPGVIVFNKQDLYDDARRVYQEELFALYEPLGYRCLMTSAETGAGLDELRAQLEGRINLLSGHSGVGKSTLMNRLAPGLNLRTQEVSTFANKGVHTTTFAEMFELAPGTWLIDTPGIKELGMIDMEEQELAHYFPEMRALLGECRFHNCTHLHEPGCAVYEAFEAGEIAASRYQSYLSMMGEDDNRR